ncbi:MAG: GNAT family N-acetyltransferase [Myxococcota bacterium]
MATTQPQFSIRLATRKDSKLVLEFIRDLARFEELLHKVTTTQRQLQQTLFHDSPLASVVLGYENKEPAAFAVYFFGFSTFQGGPILCISDLFVPTQHRGKGYGQALMQHLSKIALDRDCVCVEWGAIKYNTAATGFYERLGAKPVKERLIYHLNHDTMTTLAQGKLPTQEP